MIKLCWFQSNLCAEVAETKSVCVGRRKTTTGEAWYGIAQGRVRGLGLGFGLVLRVGLGFG